MREFGNLLMNEANEPPQSLFAKLLFESCWDLVLSMDPTRMAIWRTSLLSSWCLFRKHLLGALVSTMLCLKARATNWRICRALSGARLN